MKRGACHLCGNAGPIHTHHIEYEPVERTIDICPNCHARIHGGDLRPDLKPPPHTRGRVRDWLNVDAFGIRGPGHRDTELPAFEQASRCETWIRNHTRPYGRRLCERNSYSLKHVVEGGCRACRIPFQYVSNGAFIWAALRLGVPVVREKEDSPNARFAFEVFRGNAEHESEGCP